MNTKLINSSLFVTTLLTGFYAGLGFFTIVGNNPAILKMSAATFAEYWQHVDFYMAARMQVFGPLLLVTLLSTVLIHIPQRRTVSFLFLSIGLVIMLADVLFAVSTNHPLNQVIQSWDLNNLPDNVQEIKYKVVNAFWIRSSCMIATFVCVLLAIFLRCR